MGLKSSGRVFCSVAFPDHGVTAGNLARERVPFAWGHKRVAICYVLRASILITATFMSLRGYRSTSALESLWP